MLSIEDKLDFDYLSQIMHVSWICEVDTTTDTW